MLRYAHRRRNMWRMLLLPCAFVFVFAFATVFAKAQNDVKGVELTVNECGYDEATGRFTPDGARPDWIILQRSPLAAYSYVPAGIERLVREQYDLVRTFVAEAPDPRATYDQQDAFFLPLTGLDTVKRPGPNFEIYRLRTRGSAASL